MDIRRSRKLESAHKKATLNTNFNNKPLTLRLIKLLKYIRFFVFILGLALFAIGVAGEYMHMEGYNYYSLTRFGRKGVNTEPYWFNCIYGMVFMLLAIRRKWLVKQFKNRR